ncbi:MAG: GGDEF domain-containing protein [Bacillaceae bacterium]
MNHSVRFQRVFFTCLFIFSLVAIVFTIIYSTKMTPVIHATNIEEVKIDWHYLLPKEQKHGTITLPGEIKEAKANEPFIIEGTFQVNKNDTILLRSLNQDIHVYINDKLVETYERNNKSNIKKITTPKWHFIATDSEEIKLRIEYETPYPYYAGKLNEIYHGSSNDLLSFILLKYLPSFFLGLLALLNGVFLLFLRFALVKIKERPAELLYIGLFSLLTGIWLMTESRVWDLFMTSPSLKYMMCFSAYYLLPIPLLLYMEKIFTNNWKHYFLGLAYFSGFFFIVASILEYTNIFDYIQFIPYYNTYLSIVLIITAIIVTNEIKNEGIQKNKYFWPGLIILMFCALGDMIISTITEYHYVNNLFQLGLLILSFFMAFNLFHEIYRIYKIKYEFEKMSSLFYTDALTNLRNVAAFLEMKIFVDTYKTRYDNISIIMLDINDLKETNDNLGHAYGDELIKSAATHMKVFFDTEEIYRIGGDEFVIINFEKTQKQIETKIGQFKEYLTHYNKTTTLPLHIAIGYAMVQSEEAFQQTFERADSNMYINKREMKQRVTHHLRIYAK